MATSSNQPINPDDSLPPVEPPSAAFLVQLFLVPGIIVAIIVCVWLAFHWLAHLGNDPQAYVRTLRRANEGRWQAALNLANDLRGPNGSGLKADIKLASELGSILDDKLTVAELASNQRRCASIYVELLESLLFRRQRRHLFVVSMKMTMILQPRQQSRHWRF